MTDRDILFRGKRLDDWEWVEGYYAKTSTGQDYILPRSEYISFNYQTIATGGFVEVDPSTVCRYTGLTDKYGTRVFEGDIILWVDWKGKTHESIVQFDPEWNRYCVWLSGAESMGVNGHLSKDIEVTGNRWDTEQMGGGQHE